jgi:hypothetical protein
MVSVLFGVLLWRNYVFAKRVSMTLYSKGLVLGTAAGPVQCPYHKLTAVYFGTRSEGMKLYLSLGRFLASGATSLVRSQLKSKLTFEIKDERGVAFVNLDRYFKAESLLVFLVKLEKHTSVSDGVLGDFISQ